MEPVGVGWGVRQNYVTNRLQVFGTVFFSLHMIEPYTSWTINWCTLGHYVWTVHIHKQMFVTVTYMESSTAV